MSEFEAVTTLRSLAWIAGLWVLYFWLYRDYRVDVFRQKMFAIRDELFDDASAGLLPFDHPAYGMLRSTINGYIRFAHRMTFLQSLLYLLMSRERPRDVETSFGGRWERASADLSGDVREALDRYIQRMHGEIVKHLIFGSPVILALLFLLTLGTVVVILNYRIRRISRFFERPLLRVDTVAVAGT